MLRLLKELGRQSQKLGMNLAIEVKEDILIRFTNRDNNNFGFAVFHEKSEVGRITINEYNKSTLTLFTEESIQSFVFLFGEFENIQLLSHSNKEKNEEEISEFQKLANKYNIVIRLSFKNSKEKIALFPIGVVDKEGVLFEEFEGFKYKKIHISKEQSIILSTLNLSPYVQKLYVRKQDDMDVYYISFKEDLEEFDGLFSTQMLTKIYLSISDIFQETNIDHAFEFEEMDEPHVSYTLLFEKIFEKH